jgi:hypothetical protein
MQEEYSYVPCNSWVPVNPPRPSNPSLTVKDSKLIESKLPLQLARHGDARGSSTNNDHRIVRVRIVPVSIHPPYRFVDHVDLMFESKSGCPSVRAVTSSRACADAGQGGVLIVSSSQLNPQIARVPDSANGESGGLRTGSLPSARASFGCSDARYGGVGWEGDAAVPRYVFHQGSEIDRSHKTVRCPEACGNLGFGESACACVSRIYPWTG